MADIPVPVKVNDIIELQINDINHQGAGVGRYHGFAVFVPFTCVGEIILATITEIKKSFAAASLVKVLKSSDNRQIHSCSEYMKCGGCQLQHSSYAEQLKLKEKFVRDNLKRISGLPDAVVLPTIGMENPWNYRNKIHLHAGRKNNRTVLGFFSEGSHMLVEGTACCQINDGRLNEISAILEDLINKYKLEPYNKHSKKGLLRGVMLRKAEATGQVMLVLVTVSGNLPGQSTFTRELVNQCPDITSIIRNINNGNNSLLLGSVNKLIWGKEIIVDKIKDLSFYISANSFYQVNPKQTIKLYDKALEYAELKGNETVLDAYCGIGTIAMYFSANARKVTGLESLNIAVKDACENAALNRLNNVEFLCGEVEKLLPEFAERNNNVDIIILDPPRQGCKQVVLEAIAKMRIPKIIYVSCNPGTLARDLGLLDKLGYGIIEVQPVDMFPQTSHIEICTFLSKI
jgi:23S rRNA (uracil1939-C5)-methyltransferase